MLEILSFFEGLLPWWTALELYYVRQPRRDASGDWRDCKQFQRVISPALK